MPKGEWVKLNTDVSFRKEFGFAGCGGAFRDSNGNWLVGFYTNLRKASGVLAELWGLFLGLELVWYAGLKKVIMQLDFKFVVEVDYECIYNHHPRYELVIGCKYLLGRK